MGVYWLWYTASSPTPPTCMHFMIHEVARVYTGGNTSKQILEDQYYYTLDEGNVRLYTQPQS